MSLLQAVDCPQCKEPLFHDGGVAGRIMACPRCNASYQIPPDSRWHNDPPRQVRDEEIALECRIAGQAPVQADGRVRGHPFYFRAKWSHWTCTVCVSADIDASCIGPRADENGFFEDGEHEGFYLSGPFPNASYMSLGAAEAIIRDCVREFLKRDADGGVIGAAK